MPELSIIVPVYKVEKYLHKCIDSILNQTFRDFELILIDDGSPDNCGAICDEYAAKDGRIKVIHQENAGVSAARNAGLDIATGTYLGFVDSDDWIEPEMYEKLVDAIRENNRDVAICGVSYVHENSERDYDGFVAEQELTQEDLITELFGKPGILGTGIWNKIYCSKQIASVRFDETRRYAEDSVFLLQSFLKCPSGGIKIADPSYHYVLRENSASHNSTVQTYYLGLVLLETLLIILRNSRRQYMGIGIDKYIDECQKYIPLIRKNGKLGGEPYRTKIWHIKRIMLKWIAYEIIHKVSTRSCVHSHIYALMKL